MKILVVGEGHSPIHEVAVVDAFKKLNQKVEPFYWHSYFNSNSLIKKTWVDIKITNGSISKIKEGVFKIDKYKAV